MIDNSENNKRIAKNTLMLYIRMFLIMVIRLYSSRVVLDVLGIDDYGLYNVIGGMVVLFTFVNNAMTDSTQRFLTFELGINNIESLGTVFKTSKIIHLCIAIAFLFILEIFGTWFVSSQMTIPDDRIDACLWVMHFSIFTTILKIICVPYNSLIIAHERMTVYSIISVIEALGLLLIILILPSLDGDKLIFYGILVFIVQVFLQIIYRVYCQTVFEECTINCRLSMSKSFEMIKFAGWNICGNMAQLVSSHGLNMLLNVFFNPAVNAARGIAVTVQGAIGQFSGSFQSAINPQITKSYAKEDIGYMSQLVFSSSKYTYLLLLVISLPLYFQTDYILGLWLKEVPEMTVTFLRLIIGCTILEAIVNPFNVAVGATGNIKKYQLYNGIINMSIIPIVFVSFWIGLPASSAFYIQLILCFISMLARLVIMRQVLGINVQSYFEDVISKCMLVTLISLVLPTICLCLHIGSFLQFILVTLTCLGSTICSSLMIGLNSTERQVLSKYIHARLRR